MRTGRGSYGKKPQDPSTLGQRIRAVRLSWGWTLEELGAAVHYSRNAVWHWEKGIQTPGDPALGVVADLFGLTKEALITGVGFRVTDPPRQMGSLLLAENYAADLVVLPQNDGGHLICIDKATDTHEQLSLTRLTQTIRAARANHRPVWVVLGPPTPRSGQGLEPDGQERSASGTTLDQA